MEASRRIGTLFSEILFSLLQQEGTSVDTAFSDRLGDTSRYSNWNEPGAIFRMLCSWNEKKHVLTIRLSSDPVREVLSYLIYYLAIHPEDLLEVRRELSSIDVQDYKALQHLVHLNACIYETLRLTPAVPTAGLRLSPKGGITINGTFIPEWTTLVTPQYSLSRGKLLTCRTCGLDNRLIMTQTILASYSRNSGSLNVSAPSRNLS